MVKKKKKDGKESLTDDVGSFRRCSLSGPTLIIGKIKGSGGDSPVLPSPDIKFSEICYDSGSQILVCIRITWWIC